MEGSKIIGKVIASALAQFSREDDYYIGQIIGVAVRDAVKGYARQMANTDEFIRGIKDGLDLDLD